MVKQKRKVNIEQEVTEPLSKVSKTDEVILPDNHKTSLQNMKKPDLLKYCKELEMKCDALQDQIRILGKEKEGDKKTIDQLKESLDILEMQNKLLKEQDENFEYHCSDCDFESNCVHCFSDHDHEEENDKVSQTNNFTCYFCEDTFKTQNCVMSHTKLSHSDKVSHCIYFLEGTCRFGDRCWFLHDEKFKECEPTFTCNLCDSAFKTKSKLMNHKKLLHINSVSKCSNDDKNCKYGSEKCWFLHSENVKQAFETARNVNTNLNIENSKRSTDNNHADR